MVVGWVWPRARRMSAGGNGLRILLVTADAVDRAAHELAEAAVGSCPVPVMPSGRLAAAGRGCNDGAN